MGVLKINCVKYTSSHKNPFYAFRLAALLKNGSVTRVFRWGFWNFQHSFFKETLRKTISNESPSQLQASLNYLSIFLKIVFPEMLKADAANTLFGSALFPTILMNLTGDTCPYISFQCKRNEFWDNIQVLILLA